MKAVFLANVGSRDVQVDGLANLPKDSQTLGEVIQADFDTYREHLRYPILVKTLEATLKSHSGRLDRILLFATEQMDTRYKHTNTLPFAQLIQRHLHERFWKQADPWIDQAVEIVVIHDNPADYDQMMGFYEQALSHVPDAEKVYLAVTGGTPAMSFMMLWQGVQRFGAKSIPLYVTQERPVPSVLDIGFTLVVKAVSQDFRTSLEEYEFAAARRLLEENRAILEQAWGPIQYHAIAALTRYATERFNFNFDLAQGALFGIEVKLAPESVTQIHRLIDEIAGRDDSWLLGEEILGVEMDFSRGAFKDAVANIFAFRESLLRQMTIQAGAELDRDGRKLEPGWVDSIAGLRDYLENKNINLSRSVTTFVFEMVLEYLSQQHQLDQRHLDLRKRIEALKSLSDLRNTSTHHHGGVSRELVEETYGAALGQISADLRGIYEVFAGRTVTPYDYNNVRQVILSLMGDTL